MTKTGLRKNKGSHLHVRPQDLSEEVTFGPEVRRKEKRS
jgi:hypothetical protein